MKELLSYRCRFLNQTSISRDTAWKSQFSQLAYLQLRATQLQPIVNKLLRSIDLLALFNKLLQIYCFRINNYRSSKIWYQNETEWSVHKYVLDSKISTLEILSSADAWGVSNPAPLSDSNMDTCYIEVINDAGILHIYWYADQENLTWAHQHLIEMMPKHITSLIESISNHIHQPITELNILSQQEREQIMSEWNATHTHYPKDKTLSMLFEEQAAKTPQNIAIRYESTTLTYQQLNQKANELAHYILLQFKIKPGNVIAIYANRSPLVIIAVVAIIKLGCPYLIIDTQSTKKQVMTILEESKAPLLFYDAHYQQQTEANTKFINIETCCLDQIHSLHNQPIHNPKNALQPYLPAYVIYTSGSTDIAKGIVIPHQAVIRLVKNTNYITIEEGDSIAHIANPAYDVTTFEIWGTLLNGAQMHIYSHATILSIEKFSTELKKNKTKIINVVATLFNHLIKINPSIFDHASTVFIGGESLNYKITNAYLQRLKQHNLTTLQCINAFGPSENTTMSTYYPIKQLQKSIRSIPIGKPVANSQVYILDKYKNIMPTGVIGELYLAGDGLALGFIGKSKLNNSAFITHCFPNNYCTRLYKSGDLGRWLPDGNIEFFARIDDQVKINGNHVELPWIECCLIKTPGIREAVVIFKKDENDNKTLTAYLTLEQESENFTLSSLLQRLQKQIPRYAIPNQFIILEEFPLTANGKLNKKILSQLPGKPLKHDIKLPDNLKPIEKKLLNIMQNTLATNNINLDDNFLEIGKSLGLANALVGINQAFNTELSIVDLFNHPTTQKLSEFLSEQQLDESTFNEAEQPYNLTDFSDEQDRALKKKQINRQRRASIDLTE